MKPTLCICTECYKNLLYINKFCVYACELVCGSHLENDEFIINNLISPMSNEAFDILESKGFVKSTEVSQDEVSIKPTGFNFYEFEGYGCYCWCKSKD